ncbi:MAG: hypothetical protein ABIH75_02210 [Candidatus Omnitrophota bacterium]
MRFKTQNLRFKIFLLVTVCFLLPAILGCDAFVRKFTRKQKKEDLPVEQMVLVPEEYKPPQMTKEEAYRQYFLYWKSWHDELINALSTRASQKKQIYCANEALKNLEELRKALQEARQKKLDVYIKQLKDLNKDISEDMYGNDASGNRLTAERIRRGILRDFSYKKIKDYLV